MSPRISIQWFAERMEEKLAANDHKGDWLGANANLGYLMKRLREEVEELQESLTDLLAERYADYRPLTVSKDEAVRECADVANFAMMIAERCRALHEKWERKERGK